MKHYEQVFVNVFEKKEMLWSIDCGVVILMIKTI